MRRFDAGLRYGLLAVMAAAMASSAPYAPLGAQAWQCRAPANLPRPQIELPPSGSVRRTPVDGYILALSWSPEYCKGRRGKSLQCDGKIGDFGFILHGLWPEAKGPDYPQYCRKTALLPRKVVAENICMTPDVQLLQHEWAKHGSCMARRPETYFGAGTLMFEAIEFPDMDWLSRRGAREARAGKPMTAAAFADEFAKINDGLPASAIRVKANGRRWLQEVRICLGKDFKPRPCRAFTGGTRAGAEVKIWRGG
ncbi:ribonuclease T [Sphingorhabdus arenilitoris]|uniref:Ribonuclease T n=1 Tax=Sphingorhabdus arenilitoris TaxID=1490041 RepID=A0ABV8RK11_9SPHN